MKNFPMFLQMSGRRVLIIGGGEEAAQKARLILKTEAEIVVLAPVLKPELQLYVDEGKIVHLDEPLTADIMQSAILVFSATGCAETGAAHAVLAKETNTLLNVVDMPDYCDAITPSIVDRDPLVVAIGTEGCAPILGRQIKSKVEMMLEPNLGDLVAFVGRMRGEVARNIPVTKRRAFWNWVFNSAPRQAFRMGNNRRSFAAIKDAIYAGGKHINGDCDFSVITSQNGAPDNLRLGEVARLQEADQIFFVKGLHEDIVELARRDALRFGFRDAKQLAQRIEDLKINKFGTSKNIAIITTTDLPFTTRTFGSVTSAVYH